MNGRHWLVFGAIALALSSCGTVPEVAEPADAASASHSQMPGASDSDAAAAPDPCAYDRDEMLALDVIAFDQTAPSGGWRRLNVDGCYLRAADLIRDYRETHQSDYMPLYWHEAQMRAMGGQNDRALALFEQARARVPPGFWEHYADATLAFMKRDKQALIQSRNALASLPRPENFKPRDARGNPVAVTWPPFLDVTDRLVRCFDRSYLEAYRFCEEPDSDAR